MALLDNQLIPSNDSGGLTAAMLNQLKKKDVQASASAPMPTIDQIQQDSSAAPAQPAAPGSSYSSAAPALPMTDAKGNDTNVFVTSKGQNPTFDKLFGDPAIANQASAPNYQKYDLSRQNPLPWEQYLDERIAGPGNGNSLAQKAYEGSLDPNKIPNQLLNGVGSDKAGVAGVGDGLGSHNAMSSAISKRYAEKTAGNLNSIKTATQANAPVAQSAEMNRAASMYGQDQAIAMSNFKEQYAYQQQRQTMLTQWQNAKSAAESSIWGTIAGVAGAVVGTIATGGAATGAIIGGQLGSAGGKIATS